MRSEEGSQRPGEWNTKERFAVLCSDIELLKRNVASVSDQASESEKTIVQMETKIEYIIKGVDEIKAEVKSK